MMRFCLIAIGIWLASWCPAFCELRIISLSPASTEIICTLNQLTHLVGVSQFCNYPAAVKSKPVVGGFLNPDVEKIIQLRPTHVIGIGQPETQALRRLRAQGVRVILFESPSSLHALNQIIQDIGQTLDASARATQVITHIKSKTQPTPSKHRPKTLVVLWHTPLSVAGPSTFISDVVTRAGGRSALSKSATAYPSISKEHAFRLNPDVVVVTDPAIRGYLLQDPLLKRLPAIKNHRVILIKNEDAFLRAGPRIGESVQTLRDEFRALHVL